MKTIDELAKDLDKRMRKLTRHEHVHIVDRCNFAIFMSLAIVKKINEGKDKLVLLIPDQGGWYSFKRYPKYFGMEIVEVKTDYGVIDLKDLRKKSKNADALLFTSFAGYFAEQPLKKIKTICSKNKCMLIEDASGAIGDRKLCNGKYSDITVGSFSRWKPVSYGYGGWISVNKKEYLQKVREVVSMCRVHEKFYKDIVKVLRANRLKKRIELQEKVKEDLNDFEVLHRDKRGLNVIVKFDPKVITYCLEKKFQHILCPSYIRCNEKAVSIELKRLPIEEVKERLKKWE
jgi:dTDP-4-amino-4,6-dideoxygalactose transaminase